jgi:hypothetical protein
MVSGRMLFGGNKTGLPDKEGKSGNQAILECVEKGLLSSLGVSAEAATLYFIELNGGLKLSRISDNPHKFVEVLRVIFGAGSAELLKAISRELRLKEAKGRDRLLRDFAAVVEQAIKPAEAGGI